MIRTRMPFRVPHAGLKRYLTCAGLVAAATLLTFAIKPFFAGKAPLLFFTIAVVLSAGYGGVGMGLLATALSLGVSFSLFQDRVFPLVLAHSSLTLFAVIGVAIAMVVGKLRALNDALMAAREELQAANKELSLANERLSEQGDALARSNEELQRFAYGLAHDLHNPLRSIGALTELLIARNADKLDQSSTECARMIVDGVKRMESMIKSLLDYAAAAENPESRALADCNAIVKTVLQDLNPLMEASGAVVKLDRLPALRVDEIRLGQVFANLIGNAIKYRNPLRPEVHISAAEQDACWLFSVQDNGIGFDMKYADDIFGLFKRLHRSALYEGSGVGLAFCKVMIRRCGGEIWAESAPGKGSTFFFTLPKIGPEGKTARTPPAGEPFHADQRPGGDA